MKKSLLSAPKRLQRLQYIPYHTNKLKPHLVRYGLPDRLTTDNGPQFDCAEFQKFAAE